MTSLTAGRKWAVIAGAVLIAVVGACADIPSSQRTSRRSPGSSSAQRGQENDPVESPAESAASPGTKTSTKSSGKSTSRPERGPFAEVSRVIDGDTVEVRLRGRTLDIRLIGVDTPETVHPFKPVQCFGPQASSFTESTLLGERVRLEFDVERVDRYGRTLAYLWLRDKMFNQMLVRRGFAQVSTYPPNVKYVDRFLDAQRKARATESGLWGAVCAKGSSGADKDAGSAGGGAKCDPNYTGTCVPQVSYDLDCGDISGSVKVVGTDKHGFDGDGDGYGCEAN
jgi:micrococcal nuclease